jgi:hypothetical protein
MIERLQANPDVLRFHVPTDAKEPPGCCQPEKQEAAPVWPRFPGTDDPSLNVSDGDESPSVEAPLQRTAGQINPCVAKEPPRCKAMGRGTSQPSG